VLHHLRATANFTIMPSKNRCPEPNWHLFTFLHPILLCRITYWVPLEMLSYQPKWSIPPSLEQEFICLLVSLPLLNRSSLASLSLSLSFQSSDSPSHCYQDSCLHSIDSGAITPTFLGFKDHADTHAKAKKHKSVVSKAYWRHKGDGSWSSFLEVAR
jgi:hypothetical protein